MGSTHTLEFALLQHPQQLDLKRRSEFPDLIQKHHAAIGDFEPALFLQHGSGE